MTTVLPDRPISELAEDFLDRDAFAQNIADLILHAPPQGSLRIGVYGGWGEGKTSVLKLIHGHLCDAGHVCVWLTPWISSNREEVVEQLVRAIAAELQIDIDKLDVAKGTVQLAERLRKPAAEINIKFKLAESVFGPIVQRYLDKKAAGQWYILLSEIEKGLSGRKLIVFVDDLDRVRPELVPNMLLTLREGLDQPDYFYVMALAPEVIERGLKMVHEGWGGPREFLEKIVELPKYLPRPTAEERHRFTSALLQTLGSSMDAAAIMDLAPLLSDNPRKLKLFLRYVASLKGLLSRFSPGELDWR